MQLKSLLRTTPVVGLLGPRQVGKTTLARAIGGDLARAALYLDLERPSDRAKLADAELFLEGRAGQLTILDEVQRQPSIFAVLRSLVDDRMRDGERAGHFLVLGSASRDLLQQSSESLAGRIAYVELSPFTLDEVQTTQKPDVVDRLWVRGGFPNSYLAQDEAESRTWREQFVMTFLQRDLPELGLRLPAERLRRFWSMLAHAQGSQLNAAKLASGLGVSGNTVRHDLDVLTDLFMVRQLAPWSGNSTKRLTKSPKIYVRDSGLVHQLTRIVDLDLLLGHPLCGPSWEGFVIEQCLARLPSTWDASYYRTSAQAEIDLVLEGPRREVIAIEIKRSLAPKISRGFRNGYEDIGATRGIFVTPTGDRFPLAEGVEAIPLQECIEVLEQLFE